MKKHLLTLAAVVALATSATAQTFSDRTTSYTMSYVSADPNQTCYGNFTPSNGGVAFPGGNVQSVSYVQTGSPAAYSQITFNGKAAAANLSTAAPYWMFLSEVAGSGPTAQCVALSSQASIVQGSHSIDLSPAGSKFQITAKSSVDGVKLRVFLGYSHENGFPGKSSYVDLTTISTATLTTSFADYTFDFTEWANRDSVNLYGIIIEDGGSVKVDVKQVKFGVITGTSSANQVNDQVTLAPNPAVNGSFELNMSAMANTEAASVKVMNSNGIVVKELSTSSDRLDVSTAGMNRGIYMVQITSGNKVATKKVVVE